MRIIPFVMSYIFVGLTHIVILVGMIAILYFICYMIRTESVIVEKIIRTAAAMTGFLIYFGAKAIGVSIPSLMMSAVSTTNPITLGFVGVILPSATGVLVAWYSILCINRSEEIASRIVILITTFILVMFADVYGASFKIESRQFEPGVVLVPNLTFTIAMSLYVIFRYRHKTS